MTSAYTTSEIKQRKLRDMIKKQKGVCPLCGKQLAPQAANLDHIVPKAIGGSGSLWNLRATHVGCNSKRADKYEDSPEYRDALTMHYRLGLYIDQSDPRSSYTNPSEQETLTGRQRA